MSFSKDPSAVLQDALQKGYTRVRYQQGKPVLDRELNLAGDLADPERLARTYVGDGIADAGNGFRLTGLNVPGNDFTIAAGRALVGGREVVLPADTSYQNQPVKTNVKPLPVGVSSASLRAFTRLVTEAEDASLKNTGAGDVGSVTALREKVEWEVVVTPGNNIPAGHARLATINAAANTITDDRRTGLKLSFVRDEVASARGNLPQLAGRLNTSLTADGVLKANTVGNLQIADNVVTAKKLADLSVTTNKLADLNVTAVKLAANAVQEPKLADNSVSKRTLQDNAVSIAELSKSLVVNTSVTVPAAAAVGQLGLFVQNIQTVDEDAFYLISVRQVSPRPLDPPAQSQNFTWVHRVAVSKAFGAATYQHTHQILIQNPQLVAITVFVKAYRIAET